MEALEAWKQETAEERRASEGTGEWQGRIVARDVESAVVELTSWRGGQRRSELRQWAWQRGQAWSGVWPQFG